MGSWQIFKSLIQLLKPLRSLALQALLLSILASLLEGLAAALVIPLTQVLSNAANSSNLAATQPLKNLVDFYAQFPSQWRLLAVTASFFMLSAMKNLNVYFSSITINQLQLQVGLNIRQVCVERFIQLELAFYHQSKLGELISYVNEHVQRCERLVSAGLEIFRNAITILILAGLLFTISPSLTLLVVSILALIAWLLKPIINAVQLNGRKAAIAIDAFTATIAEIISGIRIVKAFNAEARELERSQQSLQQRYQAELAAYKYNSAVAPLTETAGIAVLLLLLVTGTQILGGMQAATLPILLTYTLALLRMLPRVSHLNNMRSEIYLLFGSWEAIAYFLSSTDNTALPDGDRPFSSLKSAIVFENVSFTFPTNSEPTLKQVNFFIPQGKITAIVGASGSGKSTLADLLMRFHDPTSGSIKIDGIDLKELQISAWRQAVAMVNQDTFLFNTSIKENIAYGSPQATNVEIIAAAKSAYASDFIAELPEKFNTIVGNRGGKLSGGQRQRIAIARAMLRQPEILILDEATSALDNNSEQIVQKALEIASCGRTIVAIAHRLSTIEKADNIVVLRQGQVIEQGTHQELLAKQGEYWSLYQSQVATNIDNSSI